MNYIKEMNALYDRQEQTPISGSAIALWSALMNINNKTRWKNTFTSPASVLQWKAGLTESSFKRARAELVKLGYIEVESQGRGKAPIYTMHSLVVEAALENAQENRNIENQGAEISTPQHEHAVEFPQPMMYDPSVQQADHETAPVLPDPLADDKNQVMVDLPPHDVNQGLNHVPTHHADHLPTDLPPHLPDQEPAPLYKQYITKPKQNQNKINTSAADAREQVISGTQNNESKKKTDAIMFYQDNFGMAGPFVAESLMDWIHSLGEALVVEAMKRALEQNKTSWSYVKGILNNWYKKGIRTVEQAQAEQVAFENERKQKRGQHQGFFGVKKDIVPDWYEAERERQWKKWEQEEVRDPEEEKRMQEKVAEMLREFGV